MSSPLRITAAALLALAAAVALVLAATGCGGGGAAAEPPGPVVGNYDRTTLLSFQRSRVTDRLTGLSHVETRQVVESSATGYRRRFWQGTSTAPSESTYLVEGGGVLLTATASYGFGALGPPSVGTFDPGALLLPADLTPGAVTTTTSDVTFDGLASYSTTRTVTVAGVEPVTVPAGTFQALKATYRITFSDVPAVYTGALWWAPGVGRVREEDGENGGPPRTVVELLEQGKGPLPILTPNGGYQITALTCAGQPAPSPLADLLTGGSVMGLLVQGATGAIHWSTDACTIRQPLDLAYPAIGQVTATPSGPFACVPSAAACQAHSLEVFGEDVCGRADAGGARPYTFSDTGVPVGEGLTLRRVGGTECADAGAADPLRYVLTRTE